MNEHQHKSHPHSAHPRKTAEHPHDVDGGHRTEAPHAPTVPDELTLYTEDGKWKAKIRAWKDYWLFYASIGAEVDVYERRETRDVWGHTTTDWVATPANIFITANFQGTVGNPPAPTNPPGGPGNGGLGDYQRSAEFHNSHGELKLWAAGFFSTNITVSGERTTPAGAILDINSVAAEIQIGTPSGSIHGTVAASSYVSDNSAWG
jgi:hypothetical protein